MMVAALMLCSVTFAQEAQQRIDTLYYDSDCKAVPHKAFAEYYRIALYPSDPSAKRLFRDFYLDGALKGKGAFVSIDAADDSNSLFDGTVESYFKNGKVESRRDYSNGILNGEYIQFFEDGLIRESGSFKNGKLNGLLTIFSQDGSYVQMEYDNGEPIHEYYVCCDPDGRMVKLKQSDNSVYWESPTISERQTVYKDGVSWLVYSKNGVTVAETYTKEKDYGKWHKLNIVISNDSLVPIEFDPEECLSAFSIRSDYTPTSLAVWSSDQYLKKVNRSQTWAAIAVGLSEGLAAANAGYSTSTSTTTSIYGGSASLYGSSLSFGSNPRMTTYTGYGSYSGSGTRITTTRSYDAAAAYQAQVISQQRMADFRNSQWVERQAKEVGYLKKNTIQPGETISGYVNVQRIDGEAFFNTIYIQDAKYQFAWRFGNNTSFRLDERIDYLANYADIYMDDIDFLRNNGAERNYYNMLKDFFIWFSETDIMNEKTVARVIELENRFFTEKSSEIESYVEANKRVKAEYSLEELKGMYLVFPIRISEREKQMESYMKGMDYLLDKMKR